jgi:hypothetical protein
MTKIEINLERSQLLIKKGRIIVIIKIKSYVLLYYEYAYLIIEIRIRIEDI